VDGTLPPVRVEAEFTVEPFVEGNPGPHVVAAVDAVRAAGLEVDMEPFGSRIEGEAAEVQRALFAMVEAATANGASRVSLQLTVVGVSPHG